MAAALSTSAGLVALEELVRSVPLDALGELGVAPSELRLCWQIHGHEPPPAVAALAAEAAPAPGPPPRDWEALAAWAEDAVVLAAPGLDGGRLVGREEDLLRGVALALLATDLPRAAALLRWLALHPRAPSIVADFRGALSTVLHLVHGEAPTDRALAAMHAAAALAMARATPGAGTEPAEAPEGPPPEPELRSKLATGTLAWIADHRDRFVVATTDDDRAEILAVKAAAELGFVARHLASDGGPNGAVGRELLGFAWEQLHGGERMRALIERHPELAVVATGYLQFHLEGHRAPSLDEALRRHAHAVPAPARFQVADSLRRMSLPVPDALRDPPPASALTRARPPWAMTRNDAYDVTHEVFATTDVGREPLPAGRAYLRRWMPVWLRWFELADDNDLLAEMIVAGHCAGLGCAPGSAWRALAGALGPDGSVRFSSRAAVTHHSVGDYHSTLMALVAATICRHGGTTTDGG